MPATIIGLATVSAGMARSYRVAIVVALLPSLLPEASEGG